MVKKKTAKRPAKKASKPVTAPSATNDDLVRELLEAGAALEARVTELEMKVASLERAELQRNVGPTVVDNNSAQVYQSL